MLKRLSHKDRSFLLFIAAGLVFLWGAFSLISFLFFRANFSNSDAAKLISQVDNSSTLRWINTSRPLEANDLKDRVILLDFWTFGCVNCLSILPEIKRMEEEYGTKLTVIGIHSGRFENEKDFDAVRKAVMRLGINHAVVNDYDSKILNKFGVTATPTLMLLDIHGNIKKTYIGADKIEKVKNDAAKLVNKYKYQITREALPIVLEKNKVARRVLDYPTKIEYGANFNFKGHNAPALFVANSGQNRILAISITGEIIAQIGSGKSGLADGNFDEAKFNFPSGLLYNSGKLYVADKANHAIRLVDFENQTVTTLVGSGIRGQIIKGEQAATKVDLSSPSDLEFFNGNNNIAIANSGSNQILELDLSKKTINVLAGSGQKSLIDGKADDAALAQPLDLAVFEGKLYFVEGESSALRVLDKEGNVKTLIGKSPNDFGHVNGKKEQALMQHPSALMADDTGIYIADSFNHAIRKYDFSSGELRDLLDNNRGDGIGSKPQFDEPDGIVSVLDRFYIVDSGNNRLLVINRRNLTSDLVDVMPQLQLPKEGFLQYLPNLYKAATINVSNHEVIIKINLLKNWKINDSGPSFINLLEMVSDSEANLIATYDWNMIKNEDLKLPKLQEGKNYMLQGTIYYCENKQNSLCYISSYEQKINVSKDEKNKQIIVELLYR